MKLLKPFISFIIAIVVGISCLPSFVLAEDNSEDVTFWGPYTLDVSLPDAPNRVLLSDGISLKEGYFEKYVDRVNFTTNARSAYDQLVEGSDGDGVGDFLIDDSYFVEDDTFSDRQVAFYTICTTTITTNPDDTIDDTIDDTTAELKPEIWAALFTFTRDYPEVFWLSGQFLIGFRLNGAQLACVLLLKDSSSSYDIREDEFQSESSIRSVIE